MSTVSCKLASDLFSQVNFDLAGRSGIQKPSPDGEGGAQRRMRSPYDAPCTYVEKVVVRSTRTSSVFPGTMQAFSGKTTFPKGEGFGLVHLPAKSVFTSLNSYLPSIFCLTGKAENKSSPRRECGQTVIPGGAVSYRFLMTDNAKILRSAQDDTANQPCHPGLGEGPSQA